MRGGDTGSADTSDTTDTGGGDLGFDGGGFDYAANKINYNHMFEQINSLDKHIKI